MSFGSLSGPAVEALNRGAAIAGCLQNTGEGGLTAHHRHGGGAKPGLGGLLPAPKVTAEIAAVRGVTAGRDCVSPSRHAEFSDADSLLDWVELLASETGLPVGIKSAVGDVQFWEDLTDLPELKSVRTANYLKTLRRDLLKVAEACGIEHPALIDVEAIELLTAGQSSVPLRELYGYEPGWGHASEADRSQIVALMNRTAPQGGSAPSPQTELGPSRSSSKPAGSGRAVPVLVERST